MLTKVAWRGFSSLWDLIAYCVEKQFITANEAWSYHQDNSNGNWAKHEQIAGYESDMERPHLDRGLRVLLVLAASRCALPLLCHHGVVVCRIVPTCC